MMQDQMLIQILHSIEIFVFFSCPKNKAGNFLCTGCKNFFYLISVILIHGRIGNNT